MAPQIAPKYAPVSPSLSRGSTDENDHEDLGFLSHELKAGPRASRPWGLKFLIGTGLNLLLFLVSCGLFGTWYYETHWRMNAALRRVNTYSPVYDMVDLEMQPVRLNGTLFPPKDPSIGRQMPNAAADAIWEEWELTRYVPVTADQIRAMGKDPSTAAKLDDEDWGLGDDAYVAIFDVYHQIHCLNTLRRMVYGRHYNESGGRFHHKTLKAEMHEVHINHCIDMVLQTLQCSGNVNLVTMHWVQEQDYPFPDMSINRQCINFEKLTHWRKENTIDLDEYVAKMKKKEGKVKELPAPDEFYRYYKPDVVNPNHLNGANPGNDFNL